ncbi:MAG: CapA family protein [Rhodospirillaceae bacterium]|nr:CapA family protein [Rhodospirillaceae bacterium]
MTMGSVLRTWMALAAVSALTACAGPTAADRSAGGQAGAAAEPAAEAPASAAVPAAPAARTAAGGLRLRMVGDIMIGTNFPDDYTPPELAPGDGADAILDAAMLAVLRDADLTLGNFEGVLFDGTGAHKTCGNPTQCYVFRSPEYYADVLADAGFDGVTLANNHSGDFLEAGRAATRAALDRAGIAYTGHDEPGVRTAIMTVNGIRVGLAGFSPNPGTLSINDPERAARIVEELDREADIVVVTFHGGAEGTGATHVPRQTEIFLGENRGDVYAFARRVIDAGADLVFGHGPHVPRALDVYRGRLIAYSLGNFWTYGRFNVSGLGGVGTVLEATLAPDGQVVAARIIGTRQQGAGIPALDPTNEAARMIAQLTVGDIPEAPISIAPDGTIALGALVSAR